MKYNDIDSFEKATNTCLAKLKEMAAEDKRGLKYHESPLREPWPQCNHCDHVDRHQEFCGPGDPEGIFPEDLKREGQAGSEIFLCNSIVVKSPAFHAGDSNTSMSSSANFQRWQNVENPPAFLSI